MTSRKRDLSVPYTDPKSKRRRVNLPAHESERRLEPFEDEARAGMPDEEMARLAGVTLSSVKRWRRKKEIRHRRQTRPGRKEGERRLAMNLLGEPLEDVLHRVHGTATSGTWEPPQYCLRSGVDYDKLCWQIYSMHRILGISLPDIADAHGYTQKTVGDALAVYEEWLRSHGGKCERCDIVIDPERQYGCSGSCIGAA